MLPLLKEIETKQIHTGLKNEQKKKNQGSLTNLPWA